jgi:hypothetical protein
MSANQPTQSNTAQDAYRQAMNVLEGVSSLVFFNKLASLGVEPANEQEAASLWQMGINTFKELPPGSAQYATVKQASMQVFGTFDAVPIGGGYSKEACALAEQVVTIPAFREAVSVLQAIENA